MDRKIDAGALLVAAAATLLVVALFLDWFGLDGTSGLSGWEVFEVLDLVLLSAAVAAVAAAFGRADSRVLIAAAVVAVVVVATQLIEPPPAGQGADREIGAWLGLAGALGLLAGAALVAAQIAVTLDVRGRERRRRVPTVDRRFGGQEVDEDRVAGTDPAVAAPHDRMAGSGSVAAPGGEDATDGFAPEPSFAPESPPPPRPRPAASAPPAAPAGPDATQPFDAQVDEPER